MSCRSKLDLLSPAQQSSFTDNDPDGGEYSSLPVRVFSTKTQKENGIGFLINNASVMQDSRILSTAKRNGLYYQKWLLAFKWTFKNSNVTFVTSKTLPNS